MTSSNQSYSKAPSQTQERHQSEPPRILLFHPDRGRWEVFPIQSIVMIRAEERHSRFFFSDGTDLLLKYHGISQTEEALATFADLIRINRREIVNLKAISAVDQGWRVVYLKKPAGKYSFASVGKTFRIAFRHRFSKQFVCLSSRTDGQEAVFMTKE